MVGHFSVPIDTFDTETVLFNFLTKNKIYAIDDVKKTVVMNALVTSQSHLKGFFGISDGKALKLLLERENLSIISHNESENGDTRSLTFRNDETGFDTNVYFDKKEKISIARSVFREENFNYQVIFSVDNKLYKKIKFQVNASETDYFCIENNDSNVNLIFNQGSGPAGTLVIKDLRKNETLMQDEVWYYPMNVVMKILLHAKDCIMCFSKNGHLRIICWTEYARYSYVVPALSK